MRSDSLHSQWMIQEVFIQCRSVYPIHRIRIYVGHNGILMPKKNCFPPLVSKKKKWKKSENCILETCATSQRISNWHILSVQFKLMFRLSKSFHATSADMSKSNDIRHIAFEFCCVRHTKWICWIWIIKCVYELCVRVCVGAGSMLRVTCVCALQRHCSHL